MLKFIRGKGQQPSAERQKLQRELFAFRKTVQHGFPNKPTCIAWDPALRLMAVGTASGAIKVLGKPGVEFYGQHSGSHPFIGKIVFVPNEGRLVSLCEDNSLHLWEINDMSMEELKTYKLEGKLKTISAMCLESSGQNLLLGTEGGNIYTLNITTFEISTTVIYQDVVMQKVPEDYLINPGAVEAIKEQPGHPDNILIGYNRGLMVLWNRKAPTAEQTYVSTQQLESLCWESSGSKFVSSHNDGSYAYWDVTVGSKPIEEPSTPYGPFPCKAISKLLWRQDTNEPHDDLLLFAGGMARANCGDRHTISVLKGKHVSEGKHIVFDFTSKVVDFFTIDAPDDEKGVVALVVLAEEELVAIDLVSEDWKMLSLPYLVSLHASAVTCSTYVSNVPQELWDNIVTIGKTQSKGLYSDSKWPIDGGLSQNDNDKTYRDLLLTGHEDGSVRFWDAGSISLTPLYKFTSSQALHGEEDLGEGSVAATEEEDDWPPFRKVGTFDPYSDDPRLAVKKVSLCPSGVLAVAGTAGYVIVAKLNLEEASRQLKVVTMNIVGDRDAFVWKGHEKLAVRGGGTEPLNLNPGFQPISLLQLHPPAAITALAIHSQWSLVAAGTAHGLAVFDYLRQAAVITKCTLNPNDLSGVGDAPISRRKSFKKSLRESFRRLRKGRSTRHPEKRGVQSPVTPEPRKTPSSDSPSPSRGGTTPNTPIEAKPVERAVEARPVDDSLGSMVRCLAFSRTFIISVQNMTPTLWAGTNNGTVYVFTIAVPGGSKRTEEAVSCQLGKEIQLKHRAPVIGINVIDGLSYPVEPDVKATEVNAPHRVIISSEEQIKIFTLPALKPFCKLKLTAAEGARVRRTAVAQFHAGQHDEVCLLCLTNLGDTIVLSLPDLRRQINAAVIRREDINGISSLTFTCHGEGLYLHSSSELQRVTVSASRVTTPICKLELPQSARANNATTNGNDSSSSSSSGSSSESSSSSSSEDEEDNKDDNDEDDDKVSDTHVGSRLEKVVEVKENGIGDEDATHDLSSVGDITIDSVKDHLINSNSEESRVITEIVRNESTKLETTTSESVTVKTTVITTNETTLITPPPENS